MDDTFSMYLFFKHKHKICPLFRVIGLWKVNFNKYDKVGATFNINYNTLFVNLKVYGLSESAAALRKISDLSPNNIVKLTMPLGTSSKVVTIRKPFGWHVSVFILMWLCFLGLVSGWKEQS